MVILELIHAKTPDFLEGWHSLVTQNQSRLRVSGDHNDGADRIYATVRSSFRPISSRR